MSRKALVLIVLTATLAGCGGSQTGELTEPVDGEPGGPAETGAPAETGSPSEAGLPEAADGSDLTACEDGNCEVVVTESDEIPVDPAFGVDLFTVESIEQDTVTVQATGAGTYLRVTISPSGAGSLNGILVKVVAVDGDRAVLNFST
ncbi:hypothetical protein LX16_3431 [Stackebrandtia albiflava]|uniref:Uncharacterized protein n=1 Tax=Stackebrandtia albiflava TaxID=406432 RepID=A0A562V444_9ACTN|nr:hypothetical protein [Stackebrandtia albiflava]TWJ12669.1 hypothetical protein LX16_3431 [Stackebrandtia albiflava]